MQKRCSIQISFPHQLNTRRNDGVGILGFAGIGNGNSKAARPHYVPARSGQRCKQRRKSGNGSEVENFAVWLTPFGKLEEALFTSRISRLCATYAVVLRGAPVWCCRNQRADPLSEIQMVLNIATSSRRVCFSLRRCNARKHKDK